MEVAANELGNVLNRCFNWNKARITCLSKIIIGLIATRTVNLTQIATTFGGETKYLSRYRRIQRFFRGYKIDYQTIAMFIFGLFEFKNKNLYLTIDRTNWKWGKTHINIFMLAVVYKGTAIPIIWKLLDNKGGSSKTEDRIELMQIFIKYFGKDCIAGLLADREFIGKDWFKWLIEEKIPFYIRIKDNLITTNSRGLEVDVDGLFQDIKLNEHRVLKGKRKLGKEQVYLAGSKSSKGLMIIATNMEPDNAIDIYLKRWGIETLFGCLKSRGFNFEDTHITNNESISRIIAVLTIAFCWAHKTGEWKHTEIMPIKIKKHGRPAISIFRYGLDFIRESIFCYTKLFKDCLRQIIPSVNLRS